MFRKTIFWLHLTCGVSAGLVVLMMSVTGVVLTYERQIQVWEDRSYYEAPESGQQMMTADQLITAGQNLEEFEPTSLMLSSDPTAPAVLRQGRSQTQYLNPYSGEAYNPHSDSLSAFFSTVRSVHRWFNMTGDNRSSARVITGAANLMFLFLVLSGIYLWLPKIYARATLRARILFNASNSNANARDFNWHHVFGFWAAIPLIVIISTATVFNYSWANNLVYRLAGEEPPVRNSSASVEAPVPAPVSRAPYADLINTAKTYSTEWRTITLAIPAPEANSITLTLDEGNGGQPQKRHVLTLDVSSGEVIQWEPFTDRTAGTQARRWVRFLHTGEALGLAGQTIAGIASFAAILMVWTGLALALRRFLRWLAKLKRTRAVEAAST
ncbi:MAG: PepSY domain-containing protein [Gammaproteobacteria bacterium]|nr:PepSY domain-containing protein [Gammaproteobacteria bacterium]